MGEDLTNASPDPSARAARRRSVTICCVTAVAAVALYYALPADMNELARRTTTIFFVAAVFWATEALPLFATSLCIIGLEILFLAEQGGLAGLLPAQSAFPLNADGTTMQLSYRTFLESFASPIIVLFMGGFLISSAVTKHGLDKVIAAKLIRPFTGRPIFLLYGVLGITAFFSMWMSNTATAAMMLAIIVPLVRALPEDNPFHRAVILAVPFGANIGGIGTPIGTPPNAVALAALRMAGYRIGFLDWMLVAVPLAVLMLIVAGALLYRLFPPPKGLVLPKIEKAGKINGQGRLTLLILIVTIALWLTSKWHGMSEAGVALIAAAALTALRVLGRRDVDSIDWSVLILMWGGLSLGKAMQATGMVDYIVELPIVGTITGMQGPVGGMVLAGFIVILSVTLSTFMSNTATAALIVPMAMALSPKDQGSLAIVTALACSFAMAMPVSTPPNAIAFASGKIPAVAMIRSGVVISVIAVVLLMIGYRPFVPLILNTAQKQTLAPRVAVLLPLTGPHAGMGKLQMQGYELAEQELEHMGVEVKYFDVGECEPSEAARLLETEVDPFEPTVIVGPYNSEAALTVSRLIAKRRVPLIVPTANVDSLTQRPGSTVFRIAPPQQMMAMTAAAFIGATGADWALEQIVILAEDSPYGRACAGDLTGTCLMAGLAPTRAVYFPPGKAGDTDPDELALTDRSLLILVSRAVPDCRQVVEEYGPDCRILGFSGAFSTPEFRQFIAALPPESRQEIYLLTPWQDDNGTPASEQFADRYRQRFNHAAGAGPQHHTAQAYTALLVAAAALKQARTDDLDVGQALQSLVIATPLGQVRFIDFGGYYQQNPSGAVVQDFAGDRPRTIFPIRNQQPVAMLSAVLDGVAGDAASP